MAERKWGKSQRKTRIRATNDVERIEKRQLRIWRQLRDLLGIKAEGD